MSYTGRKKFKTAREKNQVTFRNIKVALVIGALFLLIYLIMNRVAIIDSIKLYF